MSNSTIMCDSNTRGIFPNDSAQSDLIPERSKHIYNGQYNKFMDWCSKKCVSEFTEDVLLDYFDEESKTVKSSTLWSHYSMLKAMLAVRQDVNITNFVRLTTFLKRKNDGYRPKKSKVFTREELEKFLKEAPDEKFLVMKVVAIMGIAGGCRRDELVNMTLNNIQDFGTGIIVTLPFSKMDTDRTFTITDDIHLKIVRKYIKLRPFCDHNRFFVNFIGRHCTTQPVGINKIGRIPSEIAAFLNLPDVTEYTGHSFRKTSETLSVDSGDILSNGGWKSANVAEDCIENSSQKKPETSRKIAGEEKRIETCTEKVPHTFQSPTSVLKELLTMTYNFDCMCRLCMRTDAVFRDIFSEAEYVCGRIQEISPKLQITPGDGLPTQVCQECLQLVENYYNFRLQCEKSDAVLRQYLINRQNRQDILPETNAQNADLPVKVSLDSKASGTISFVSEKMEQSFVGDKIHSREESSNDEDHEQSEEQQKNRLPETNTQNADLFGKELLDSQGSTVTSTLEEVEQQLSVANKLHSRQESKNREHEENREKEKDELPKANENAAISGNEAINEDMVTVLLKELKQEPCVDDPEQSMEELNVHVFHEEGNKEEVISPESNGYEMECLVIKPEIDAYEEEEELKYEMEDSYGETKCRYQPLNDYKCLTCPEVFISKESQEQHQCATRYRCPICMKVLTNEADLCHHMLIHKKEPCRVCGKTFSEKSYYLKHLRTHSGLGYKCKDCNKVFASSNSFKAHCRSHTGEKLFVCEICGERFARIQGYKVHLNRHTGERPFQCPTCFKSFAIRTTLRNHMRIHTGEKPFVCEVCGTSFRDPAGLWRHTKNIHGDKRKNCKCSFCPKEFIQNSDLKVHLRTHTGERPYECGICAKKFMLRNCLTKHMRRHTGEENYDCTVCNRTFSSSSSRDRHVRTHTGETPYECATCGKAFSLRRDLINHVTKLEH